ncbi:hypothetical protein BB561_003213 [Smittium simulii]|uniref:N-acyl-aliphatic-L-amino acid amidohydrolase n=1 Tax=Smittium simulii TaxID=133385 RepID=A0A2T9YMI1_9FUNG|nr:hypothetical protein BB561_003213 [Smittium simulii]
MEPAPVTRFRKYLQIKTVQPTPDYAACTEFLIEQAKEIGLEYQIHECVKGKPIVILKSIGTDSALKSVLFSSHTDVVPVFEDKWDYPPFAAERVKLENGDYNIYARGAQDMKVTGSAYLEALRNLKSSGKQHKRTIIALFAPDEEINSVEGMDMFVNTEEFKKLNVGFDIDEGGPSFNDETFFYTSERVTCPVAFTAYGNTGHGSQFIEGTAIEKIMPVMNEILQFRTKQHDIIKHYGPLEILHQGEVTTANLTMLNGGTQVNVVPESYTATFDIRVTPNVDYNKFCKYLEDLAAKNDVEIQFLDKATGNPVTEYSESDPFMASLQRTLKNHNKKPRHIIMPATTDARFIRRAGVPAVGINPMLNHKLLVHGNNEYAIESEFLAAITFYEDLMIELANTL